MQRDGRRRRVLSRQHHSGQSARQQRARAAEPCCRCRMPSGRARTTTSPARKRPTTRASTTWRGSTCGRRAGARSGRRCGRFRRASTGRRSRQARRSGDSSTGPTCPATAASTAAGITSSSSSRVNELQIGVRRATEGFGTNTDADLTRILKSTVGYTLPQFHPELNTLGTIPQITFGLATTGTTSPDFTYDSRLGSTAYDWLGDVQDNMTWTRGRHTVKLGGYFEYMQNNEARGGNWYGQYQFNNNVDQPAQHELRVLERCPRRLLAVHRDRQVPADPEPSVVVRVVRPGHLAAQRSHDVRLRSAFPAGTRRTTGPTTRWRTSIRRDTTRARRRGSTTRRRSTERGSASIARRARR